MKRTSRMVLVLHRLVKMILDSAKPFDWLSLSVELVVVLLIAAGMSQ